MSLGLKFARRLDGWELAFTLLDKLGHEVMDAVMELGISIHPS